MPNVIDHACLNCTLIVFIILQNIRTQKSNANSSITVYHSMLIRFVMDYELNKDNFV